MCWHNRDRIKVMFLQRWWCLRHSGKLGVFSRGLVNGTQNPIILGGWVKLGEDVVKVSEDTWRWFSLQFDTVDGRNPAPVDRQGFSTSQVVQDSSINSMFFWIILQMVPSQLNSKKYQGHFPTVHFHESGGRVSDYEGIHIDATTSMLNILVTFILMQ